MAARKPKPEESPPQESPPQAPQEPAGEAKTEGDPGGGAKAPEAASAAPSAPRLPLVIKAARTLSANIVSGREGSELVVVCVTDEGQREEHRIPCRRDSVSITIK